LLTDPALLSDIPITYQDDHLNIPKPESPLYVDFTNLLLSSPTKTDTETLGLLSQISEAVQLERRSDSRGYFEATVKIKSELPNSLGAPPKPLAMEEIESWCCKFCFHRQVFVTQMQI
jgi:hypothetical protein